MSNRPPRLPGLLAALVVLVQTPLGAQQQGVTDAAGAAPATTELRELGIRRSAGPIQIDAQLGDAGWAGAASTVAFVEHTPREGARPPVGTEVLVTYDETNLYVAIIAADPDPGAIRAALQPRDQLWDDDWIGVGIGDSNGVGASGSKVGGGARGGQGRRWGAG